MSGFYFFNFFKNFGHLKAVEYIGDEESLSSDDQNLARSLRVSCWLNCAACGLKLKDFWGTITSCSKVC